ncbi:glycoside hydrolase family 18 protein [Amycolatopsis sp. H20-H5]|uniref:glycoside hydrolase family 18 protein n=1 Tax=Amycolatopsis sp. H20-H5 TaxID=3046309 RepID=UPI002DB5E0DF|nr:cellulose binding domain-containing protein [Amycolatopsis sp. H20-H5]MEC3981412.1 cellulose binding domain-containing protein [Amycolatopsis sp. H20-H5]
MKTIRRLRRTVALTVGALLLPAAALLVTSQFAGAATSASAGFTQASVWDSGYTASYRITAGTTALASWKLEFDLPPGTTAGTYWDSLMTASGNHYVFTNREYNGSVAAGASTSFGFNAAGNGLPLNCLLNGQPCGGGTVPTSTVPTSTGPTSTTPTSSTTTPTTPTSTVPTSTTPTTPPPAGGMTAAPYYMPLDNDPQDIGAAIVASGQKSYILAFVLAPSGGGCTPTWDGNSAQPVSADTAVAAKVAQIRQAGGDVSVSFGGYNGLELGAACGDATSLANAYQAVITKYSLTHIDLDIEGDDLGDVSGETKRFQAIKTLKQRNPNLHVTLTLPVTTIGLSDLGRAEIQRAKDLGASIDLYKEMAFDYGGPAASMADDVKKVMESVHGQLKTLRPDLDDAGVYAHTGLILMNGHTDQPSELFTQETFRALLGYVQAHRLGRFSFWALNRDRVCTVPTGWADGKCSSVSQQPYDFSKIVAQYQG